MVKDVDDFRHVVFISGGKDSAALAIWAKQNIGPDKFEMFHSITGHDALLTMNYLRNFHLFANLPNPVIMRQADFTERLAKKGLKPSGNPMRDLIMWKGRVPSAKAQFCTEHLKLAVARDWLKETADERPVILYTGIRRGESNRRSTYEEYELLTYFDCLTRRPLIDWTTEDVFKTLRVNSIPLNPLYEKGFLRVGCFPCIHARKSELNLLPDEYWDNIKSIENEVERTWFSYGTIPLTDEQKTRFSRIPRVKLKDEDGNETDEWGPDPEQVKALKNELSPSVDEVRVWAKTTRGGRQIDLFSVDELDRDIPSCMAAWGICE